MNGLTSLLSLSSATSPAVKKLLGWKQVRSGSAFYRMPLVLGPSLNKLDKNLKLNVDNVIFAWLVH